MAEQDSTSHVSGQQEPSRGKSAKRKATTKRSTSESSQAESVERTDKNSGEAAQSQTLNGDRESQVFVTIRERAYRLYEASGFKQGHDLDNWLEAERQVTGSDRRTP